MSLPRRFCVSSLLFAAPLCAADSTHASLCGETVPARFGDNVGGETESEAPVASSHRAMTMGDFSSNTQP